MGAPCAEDLEDFRAAYVKAQEIIAASALPTEISGYDSFVGKDSPVYGFCDWGEYDPEYYLPPKRFADASIFYDCWYQDNQIMNSPLP